LKPGDTKKAAPLHTARTIVAVLLVYLALMVASLVPAAVEAARPLISEAAPDFALKSLAGENLRLSEYRGQTVMLNFWSTRCGRCRDQLSKLDDLYSRHQDSEFQLLSVNIDKDANAVRKTVNNLGLQFPVLLDDQSTVSRLYDVRKIPLTVLIDPTGSVRYLYLDYRRGDEDAYMDKLVILLAE
jgi:peroxiredoxin